MRTIIRRISRCFLGFLPLAACGVLDGCSSSAPRTKLPESERYLACDDPIWDVGSAELHPPELDHTFVVCNRSAADVVTISEVKTECGCSIIDKSFDRELSPGDVSTIQVRFTPSSRPGPFRHKIAVISGTPGVSPLVLQISGNVLDNPSLASSLGKIDFGSLAGSEKRRREVDVYRYNREKISSVKLVSPSGSVTLASDLVERGNGVYGVAIELDGAQIPDGVFSETIELRSDAGRGVLVPVRGAKSNVRELFIPSVALVLTVGETKAVKLLLVEQALEMAMSEYKGDARLRVAVRGSDLVVECVDPSARGELLQGDLVLKLAMPPATIQIPLQVLCR